NIGAAFTSYHGHQHRTTFHGGAPAHLELLQAHFGNIRQSGDTVTTTEQNDMTQILTLLDATDGTQQRTPLASCHVGTGNIGITLANGVAYLGNGQAIFPQSLGTDHYLHLALRTATDIHLRYATH